MELSNLILFDDPEIREQLLPLTYTRPIADIRIGILTIREKWEDYLNLHTSGTLTVDYLSPKFPLGAGDSNLYVNASVLPDDVLTDALLALQDNEVLVADDIVIGFIKTGFESGQTDLAALKNSGNVVHYQEELFRVEYPWDIFAKNGEAIIRDFSRLAKNTVKQDFAKLTSERNELSRKDNRIFDDRDFLNHNLNILVEPGAKVRGATLNAETGPIYIGKDAEIMEGSVIRGPFALCEGGVVKMGAKIYGPTTVGPFSKVGGEVNNSVIIGYSNKGHDGFLGNSVIGEWCNIGADTNNSNLKNNYAEVKLWSYKKEKFVKTGRQFCGLIMGDHSKCGINTMFNTGTVIGVAANIFGAGFPRNFIPSFSWGGAQGFTEFKLDKVFEMAELMMSRRNVTFSTEDQTILEHLFTLTAGYRENLT